MWGFAWRVKLFVGQLREGFFRAQRRSLRVALADRVFALRDLGLVLKRFGASFQDAEVREPAQRIATRAAIDPSFPHEALRAVAGYPKREAGNLIVAQEQLAATGGSALSTRLLMRCAM